MKTVETISGRPVTIEYEDGAVTISAPSFRRGQGPDLLILDAKNAARLAKNMKRAARELEAQA